LHNVLKQSVENREVIDEEKFIRLVAGFVDRGRVGKKKGLPGWFGTRSSNIDAQAFFDTINRYLKIKGRIVPTKRCSRRTGTREYWYIVDKARDVITLFEAVKEYVTDRDLL
jgi:hypothetical protein